MSETIHAQSEGIAETPEAVSKEVPYDPGGNETAKRLRDIKDELIHLRQQDYRSAVRKGELLTEAKALFGKHGKWLPWLEVVGISPYLAQRFMKVFRVFGNRTPEFDLSYSQALTLTLLHEDDIDGFLKEEHNVGSGERKLVKNMTKRELDKVVHDYLAAIGKSTSKPRPSSVKAAGSASEEGFDKRLEAAKAAVESLISLASNETDEDTRKLQALELRDLCQLIIDHVPGADPEAE